MVATTVSHCCHYLASTYLSSDRGESVSLLALSCQRQESCSISKMKPLENRKARSVWLPGLFTLVLG